ncbi:hypothetical protein EJ04DRAFT_103121 [Polyplosphaeria fusca]|uniref:Uncharacterized protein n=1 Tax=Polyplosphaeria fusca TaxID=682080 RepID=A0A9P4R189_9PLEO|nr:hypothetical protein EJ04DRAFT_103121 [Polyplosphaeria fusca]
MSTTYLSIHDLLRVTYFYEAQSAEAESRSRSNSEASVCSNSSVCRHPASATTLGNSGRFASLETDFTPLYAGKKRDSAFSMT